MLSFFPPFHQTDADGTNGSEPRIRRVTDQKHGLLIPFTARDVLCRPALLLTLFPTREELS